MTTCTNGTNYCGLLVANGGVATQFITDFGATSANSSNGLLGDEAPQTPTPPGSRHWTGIVASNAYIATHSSRPLDSSGAPGIGSFLIKVHEVPLPAAAWLFLSGLSGLVIMKRKRS